MTGRRRKTAMTSVWPNSHLPHHCTPLSLFILFPAYTPDRGNLTKTFLFQTANVEEQRVRGQLSNKASGAERRAGVREGEGVRRPGQAPG